MSHRDLSRLFLTSLTLAAAQGCESEPPRTPEAPVDRGPRTVRLVPTPELVAHAAEFQGLSALGQGLPPGTELVAVIEHDEQAKCSPEPCKAEWLAKVPDYGRAVVLRRNGVEEVLLRGELEPALAPIDSPGKAALIARVHYTPLATCQDFENEGLACAPGSPATAIPVRTADGQFEVGTLGKQDMCPGSLHADRDVIGLGAVSVARDGAVETEGSKLVQALRQAAPGVSCYYPSRGRMPEGHVDLPLERCELEYLQRAHHQEAAAAFAFDRLVKELSAHAAPPALIANARAAAREEREHAALFAREARTLAAELGVPAALAEPSAAPENVRDLWDLLEENAVEGCVHETYAAVVATHQAAHAPSARLRAVLSSIADDEQGHAALAHRIHRWGLTVLPAEQAAALERARRVAHGALCQGVAATEAGLSLGEPAPRLAVRAFDRVAAALTSA